jgi:hypothetical protein
MCADQTKLPTIFGGFGGDDDEFSDRLVKGTRLKFVDKIWTATDGTPLHESDQFLVLGTDYALQRWVDGLPEAITEKPLPDLKALNASVPKKEWPIGRFSGQPEEPWKHVFCVYVVRENDGALFTSVNTTAGQRVAYVRLKERVKTMGVLRGAAALPVIRLAWAMMPSGFGPRPRPDFSIVGWKNLGGDSAQIVAPKPPMISGAVAEPTLKETLNDEIPRQG